MPGIPEDTFGKAGISEVAVREVARREIDLALEALADEIVYQLQKHHNLTGRAAAQAVTDGVFMARRKIGQS